MPGTLYKSFNLQEVFQKVREFKCLVYIDNKTADKGRLICLIIRELRICEKFEIVRNQILSNIIGMHFHMMQLKRLN